MNKKNRRVWIVGDTTWDVILQLPSSINLGMYHQPSKIIERCGGNAANVALGLCSGQIETGLITYLGNDEIGEKLEKVLRDSNLSQLEIFRGEEESGKCLVILDDNGGRTMIGMSMFFGELAISVKKAPILSDDIVVFVIFQEHFRDDLEYVKALGCTTVVGLYALLAEKPVEADIAIGSQSDVPANFDFTRHLDRFTKIVVTRGEKGVDEYTKSGSLHQDAFPAQAIDTTGAGDSFLAGYLTAFASGIEGGYVPLEIGARWGSLMVTIESSIPPPFSSVPGALDLLSANIPKITPN